MTTLTLVSRSRHSTATRSSRKKDKKEESHTKQQNIPSVMSWKDNVAVALDYGNNPLGVPHGYDANSPNLGVALVGAPAHQLGIQYYYAREIAEADVDDRNGDQGQGNDQGQGR